MRELGNSRTQIDAWEYCYCRNCDRIRYSYELEVTERGIRCSKCGGYNVEPPGWVNCPNETLYRLVKCARAGRGVVKGTYGYECKYYCCFRKPES